ncbi:MAG: class I SAM-dependent methyltransferase [Ignavibacteriaceae bacterium]
MPKYATNFWDERYSSKDYVYGEDPNIFFKEQLDKITIPGKLLLPGEGEGRNAVYAAKLGWQADAFDQSENAQKKALKLAKKNKVQINYSLVDLTKFIPIKNHYDAIAIIFVHFNAEYKTTFHNKMIDSLKPGGKIFLEIFSKNQIKKNSGGPQDMTMLYSLDEVNRDFHNLKTILLKEENVLLDEGDKHRGDASVIRFVGEKVGKAL